MAERTDLSQDLLFGLLALHTGMIDQARLVTAFQAWTLARSRSMADILVEQGALDGDSRGLLKALARKHLQMHGGDPAKSLAAVRVDNATRDRLAGIGDSEIHATLGHAGTEPAGASASDETGAFSIGTSTSEGQRFRILRPHAKGGLGAVFVALDEELHREVALKQIQDRFADDANSRARFLLEAEITGGLEHPGIVPVYGLGAYGDGRPFYAMRFIRGDSLKEAIADFHAAGQREAGPGARGLELQKLLRRFLDICNAIEYAHRRGILHRDLKPGNVMVGRYGETLVVDWGLAKAIGAAEVGSPLEERPLVPVATSGSSETLPGSAIGTPGYMSPEQAAGDISHLGPASDVYSLGATLYCLLTGKPPFENDDVGAVLRAVQKGEFPRPRDFDRSISPALEAVCSKAMALKPVDRYASPRALAEDVERWMADEPVSARVEPFGERARRWMRRRRTTVTAASAAVLVAAVGMAVVLVVQSKANTELRAANAREVISRRQAQSRFDLAMDAIKTYHTGVSEDVLLKEEHFDDLRRKLLHGARDFYGRLGEMLKGQTDTSSRRALGQTAYELAALTGKIASKPEAVAAHLDALAVREELSREPGSDPSSKFDVARSLIAIAALKDAIGETAESLGMLERARTVLQAVIGESSESADYQSELALCESGIAEIQLKIGNPDASLVAHARSLAISQKLVEANPAVTRYINELARAHLNMGVMLAQTDKRAEGMASLERALTIRQKLAADHPTVDEYQRNLAWSLHNNAVRLEQISDFPGALAGYEQTMAIRRNLARRNPTVTSYQLELAKSQTQLGVLLAARNRNADARGLFKQAVALCEKLVDANPTVTDFQRELAWSYHNSGAMLARSGDPAGAIDFHERALAIRKKFAAENATVTAYQRDLARSHTALAVLLVELGKQADALASFGRAHAILQKLADLNPTITDTQRDLASSFNNAGVLLERSGDRAGALLSHRRALAVRENLARSNPTVTLIQSERASSLGSIGSLLRLTGDPAGARAAFEKLATILHALPTRAPADIYNLACAHSCLAALAVDSVPGIRAAAGRAEADRAMGWLRKAVDAGYRDIANVRNDHDLDPLRSRPDFQLLMQDLQFPVDAFVH